MTRVKSKMDTRNSSSSVERRWIEGDPWQTRSRFTDGGTRSAQKGSFGKSLERYEVEFVGAKKEHRGRAIAPDISEPQKDSAHQAIRIAKG